MRIVHREVVMLTSLLPKDAQTPPMVISKRMEKELCSSEFNVSPALKLSGAGISSLFSS